MQANSNHPFVPQNNMSYNAAYPIPQSECDLMQMSMQYNPQHCYAPESIIDQPVTNIYQPHTLSSSAYTGIPYNPDYANMSSDPPAEYENSSSYPASAPHNEMDVSSASDANKQPVLRYNEIPVPQPVGANEVSSYRQFSDVTWDASVPSNKNDAPSMDKQNTSGSLPSDQKDPSPFMMYYCDKSAPAQFVEKTKQYLKQQQQQAAVTRQTGSIRKTKRQGATCGGGSYDYHIKGNVYHDRLTAPGNNRQGIDQFQDRNMTIKYDEDAYLEKIQCNSSPQIQPLSIPSFALPNTPVTDHIISNYQRQAYEHNFSETAVTQNGHMPAYYSTVAHGTDTQCTYPLTPQCEKLPYLMQQNFDPAGTASNLMMNATKPMTREASMNIKKRKELPVAEILQIHKSQAKPATLKVNTILRTLGKTKTVAVIKNHASKTTDTQPMLSSQNRSAQQCRTPTRNVVSLHQNTTQHQKTVRNQNTQHPSQGSRPYRPSRQNSPKSIHVQYFPLYTDKLGKIDDKTYIVLHDYPYKPVGSIRPFIALLPPKKINKKAYYLDKIRPSNSLSQRKMFIETPETRTPVRCC